MTSDSLFKYFLFVFRRPIVIIGVARREKPKIREKKGEKKFRKNVNKIESCDAFPEMSHFLIVSPVRDENCSERRSRRRDSVGFEFYTYGIFRDEILFVPQSYYVNVMEL